MTARLGELPARGKLLALAPHMHFRGKSFRVTTISGDQEEILLDVPNYDFNWQHLYGLKQPLPLGTLDHLKFVATFDNSKDNPVNPDATKPVFWGDQTWEEMAVAFFEVAEERNPVEDSVEQMKSLEEWISEHEQNLIDRYVEEFFQRFDGNRDGNVTESELPRIVWKKARGNLDQNGDKIVERGEVQEAAKWLFYDHDENAADK